MKRFALFILLISMFILTACTAAPTFAQSVVELPSPIQVAILAGVTFVVGWLIAQLTVKAPWLAWLAKFLGQYVDEVSMATAGAIIMAIQNQLNAIPPAWEGVANAALVLVVAILAALGLVKTARKARVPGFK